MKLSTPYYAVIFTSEKKQGIDIELYSNTAQKLREEALLIDGFIDLESAQNEKKEITISYWKSMEAIELWKNNLSHKNAKEKGKKDWYKNYSIKITKVELEY